MANLTGAYAVTRAPLRSSPSPPWTGPKEIWPVVVSRVGGVNRDEATSCLPIPATPMVCCLSSPATLHPHSFLRAMPVGPPHCLETWGHLPSAMCCPLLRGLGVSHSHPFVASSLPSHLAVQILQDPETSPVESYSSRGPCIVNGETRSKPTTTAADRVSTSTISNGCSSVLCSSRWVVMFMYLCMGKQACRSISATRPQEGPCVLALVCGAAD